MQGLLLHKSQYRRVNGSREKNARRGKFPGGTPCLGQPIGTRREGIEANPYTLVGVDSGFRQEKLRVLHAFTSALS